MRRAAKIDANHADIVKGLRAAGASVQSLAQVGKGCPDLLVGIAGRNYLLEVKNTKSPVPMRFVTPEQQRWMYAWAGQFCLVTSVEDALMIVGAK